MKDNERGAIIVEATLSLTFFVFAIIMLLSIVDICYVQSKMAVAVNSTAKEISQYTYLYGLTGLNEKHANLYNQSENSRTTIDNTVNGVTSLYGSLTSLGGTVSDVISQPEQLLDKYDEISQSINQNIDDVKDSSGKIQSEIEKIAENPNDFILGCAKLLGSNAIDKGKTELIVAPLAKVLIKKHLVNSSDGDTESFLKHLHVIPSGGKYLNGIDFSHSSICQNGSEEIKVIAEYDIQVIKLLGVDFKMHFVQCGATKAWMSGVISATEGGGN